MEQLQSSQPDSIRPNESKLNAYRLLPIRRPGPDGVLQEVDSIFPKNLSQEEKRLLLQWGAESLQVNNRTDQSETVGESLPNSVDTDIDVDANTDEPDTLDGPADAETARKDIAKQFDNQE